MNCSHNSLHVAVLDVLFFQKRLVALEGTQDLLPGELAFKNVHVHVKCPDFLVYKLSFNQTKKLIHPFEFDHGEFARFIEGY